MKNPGDLLAAVACDQAGLEEAGADGVKAPGLVACAVQAFTAHYSAACIHDVRHALEVFRGHTSERHDSRRLQLAQLTSRLPVLADGAGCFQDGNGSCGLWQDLRPPTYLVPLLLASGAASLYATVHSVTSAFLRQASVVHAIDAVEALDHALVVRHRDDRGALSRAIRRSMAITFMPRSVSSAPWARRRR